ncbi:MAG: tRNA (adenosine(37)-N6)-threonylcarbamoyltransferase complex dimerization subunit type 1 TsaB [Lachnospiraceae bacterium]|nr:tRNA (adenosine(37)-N6)-threonylcarbamoyltransferase complex dimerization subunit type 1 TsaB [Lachnospiraceae bacterium]
MRILGLDSSGLVASCAILDDDKLTAEYTLNFKKTHSQTLMPMLDVVAKAIELDLSSVDVFAVAKGPGSFTGLRIGAASIKGMADVMNKSVVAVPTVDAIAYNLFGVRDLIVPIMDARRSQVYTGIYTFEDSGEMSVIMPQCALAIEELIEIVNQKGLRAVFLGDGVPVYKDRIEELKRVSVLYAPPHQCAQRAGALCALGKILYEKGEYTNASDMRPDYLRKSQAERERENSDAG